MFRKYLSFMAAVLIAWSIIMPVSSAASLSGSDVQIRMAAVDETVVLQDAIQKTASHITAGKVDNEWQAIGLVKAGIPVPAEYEENFYNNLKSQVIGQTRYKITDIERLIMAAAAIGKDPTNVENTNLLAKIYNSENIGETDSLIRQGNNGIIFALISLDAKNYPVPANARWTREKLLTELLKYQKADGSWSLSTNTEGSTSFDITAMALTALAPYTNQSKVKNATDRTVAFLSQAQNTSGGFEEAFVGGISSEATSQVMIGLTAIGIDPRDERFTKNGVSLFDHLMSFQHADGGFKHIATDLNSNGMATEQAFQALVAFDLLLKNEGRLYDFSNDEISISISGPAQLQGMLEGNLLTVKKYLNSQWAPVSIQKMNMLNGYLIVQAGLNGSQQSAAVPSDAKHVFLVDNDRNYRDFDAAIGRPDKVWTITFNGKVHDTAENLSRIYVKDTQGNTVPAVVKVTGDGNQVTVTPKELYKSGQLYSLHITDLLSETEKQLGQPTRKLFIINE